MTGIDPFEPYLSPGPRYAGMQVRSIYIPMRDGVRLAADLYLPHGLASGERIPTLLYQTRYWRSSDPRPPLSWLARGEGDQFPATRRGKAFFVQRGYAILMADVRGTGASFGVSRHPWEEITVKDGFDLIEWIIAQPWSDGQVAGVGVSFLGTTAELLLATQHPALKAVVPQFNHPDPYTDIAAPGGLFNERFVCAWSAMNEALDRNQTSGLYRLLTRGVRPVAGNYAELRAAVAMHTENGGLADLDVPPSFRDVRHPQKGYSLDDQAVMRFRSALMESDVPILGWASWMDAGTGNAALRRFHTLPAVQRVVIGAWNHGGLNQSSPYQTKDQPLSPPMLAQQREILRFLDQCLKQLGGVERLEREIHYFTLGVETWQKSPTWPPEGMQMETWYLGPKHSLSLTAPENDETDTYRVDFRASTGTYNRWWELGVIQGKRVDYGDRALQKPYGLGYESAPLEEDVEISGDPVLRVFLACSLPDCAIYAYLEDVFPDGRIVYLTEGQLRAIHRKVCPAEESPYRLQVPYHSFCLEDASPLIPGETAEITFGLLPVSALVRKGHRIRLSLAGHDEGTFQRIPEQGVPEWQVSRSPRWPSALTLPVKRLRTSF